MRVTASFRDFVLDQLSGVDNLRARPMFGGVGLYAEDVFFGILAGDVLFFKVGDTNRREYLNCCSLVNKVAAQAIPGATPGC